MTFHYVWLVWSSAFLLPWVLLYALFPQHRVAMWWASVFMALFGLTEPIFVPGYWNPPGLFELAQRTGFDIESIIFSFAIGGIGAVLYNSIAHKRLTEIALQERPDLKFNTMVGGLLFLMPYTAFLLGLKCRRRAKSSRSGTSRPSAES